MREEVMVKMFSGAKYGNVEMSAMTAETKRMFRDLYTGEGTGCLSTVDVTVANFGVRYQVIRRGSRKGPTVKTMVWRLRSISTDRMSGTHGSQYIR